MKYALALVALVAFVSFADSGSGDAVSINGYAKAWFYMNGEENADPENTFRAYNWTALKGRLSESTYACLGVSYNSWDADGDLTICDAFLNMKMMPELSITAGQFKIPLGWAYNCSGGNLFFLDRAGVASTPEYGYYSGRDIGLNLHGQFDMVGVDLGYFNGTGIHTEANDLVTKEIAANLTVDATDWLRIAAGVGLIGQPDIEDSTGTVVIQDEWSATGINAYALADYPMSESAELIFEGEFWQFGYAGPEVTGAELNSGMDYYGMLGVNFMLEDAILHSIMPAVRYETYSPQEMVVTGADRAEDNVTMIDFCVNCFVTPANTVQIGGRNVSYEADGMEGYTDMYVGWRLNY
ncbi:MAG: hypothetical protein JXA64_03225 [Candidatus Fermentibacteraceae bacterium]|nr:hypothetical protein [Candidatus Fermentibacteraceae bacterium]MBN2608103.1 hypothetical protein [Candidatus Fermentibacteraceae bacterium]